MKSSSSSPKKCGYMTSKGTKCKNPSESCRFHCESKSSKIPDVYDLINLETVRAEDYLKQDRDNIIFIVGENEGRISMGFNKQELKRSVIDAGDYFYECKQTRKLRVDQNDIKGGKLVLLRGQGNYLVQLNALVKLMDTKDKVYQLTPERKLKNITHIDSVDVENGNLINWRGQPIQLVSSWHCQEGTEAMLYKMAKSSLGQLLDTDSSTETIDIKILESLPVPVLRDILLKTSRGDLLELCKASSEMRLRGKHTNIEKLCRSKGFQNEYNRTHSYKEYPNIFTGRLKKDKWPLESSVNIQDESGFGFRILDNPYFNTMNVIFNYKDGYRVMFTREKDGSWSVLAKISDDFDEVPDIIVKSVIAERTGRRNLFSQKTKERDNEIRSLLRQAVRELEEKYEPDETLEKIKKLLEKFGVQL